MEAATVEALEEPCVLLLSNGTEEHKGDPMHQETYACLSKMQGINFVGNVEGRDIMMGECDGLHSALAPQSHNKVTPPRELGIAGQSAGRFIPLILLRPKRLNAKTHLLWRRIGC